MKRQTRANTERARKIDKSQTNRQRDRQATQKTNSDLPEIEKTDTVTQDTVKRDKPHRASLPETQERTVRPGHSQDRRTGHTEHTVTSLNETDKQTRQTQCTQERRLPPGQAITSMRW